MRNHFQEYMRHVEDFNRSLKRIDELLDLLDKRPIQFKVNNALIEINEQLKAIRLEAEAHTKRFSRYSDLPLLAYIENNEYVGH